MKHFYLLVLVAAAAPAFAALPGAIFTTTVDGSVVNGNTKYASKCDVYLDGGPGPNAPSGAAGLPAGEYFFQVTDPSGKRLLSTDAVKNRRFRVSADGVIVQYTGIGGPAHPTGIDRDYSAKGAITIRLANTSCPADFLDSPNNGGVYKAWVTPVASYVGNIDLPGSACGNGCFFGFVPADSKTDNFKVGGRLATFCLTVDKKLTDNTGNLLPGAGWEFHLTEPLAVTNTNNFTTNSNGQLIVCDLEAGTYTIREIQKSGYTIWRLYVNGVQVPAEEAYTFSWSANRPAPSIIFVNGPHSGSGK